MARGTPGRAECGASPRDRPHRASHGKALAALRGFDAGVVAEPPRTREELLAEAAEWVWYYVVQRDVLGWHRHEEVLRAYDVPDEVRARMGPRRRTA